MSASVQGLLSQNGGHIRLLEAHDHISREIIRNAVGKSGQRFHGLWLSGLTQTTYLGIPDTELISPLKRASMIAFNDLLQPGDHRPLCAAFDADSGGDVEEIPALLAVLEIMGVSMVIIEDKSLSAPGEKVNSLESTSGNQEQADMHEFAEKIRAFKKATGSKDILTTARIESLTTRISRAEEQEEKESVQQAIQDALTRAYVYRDAGADAIMIHSKSTSSDEVLQFLHSFREKDLNTPLVVVPTTYSATTRTALYGAGANVVIYANHLMRAKISAVSEISNKLLVEQPDLFADDAELKACLEARNFGCLLHRLLARALLGQEEREETAKYRQLVQKHAKDNMNAVVLDLLDGDMSGCEANKRIISVKELLEINSRQIIFV
ncbi:hypothetical protein N7462_005883 [Penicillium macrosclerotiorum]|uniref:uncharacterized protein n=1 Tax=Penicillium macrosclerotiorum TaxID=303699 RepID=UPI002549B2A3|nr:uncharacterized protein N7462_005883 [Penicillium macrosclerotiorum]KAJ5682718.1 hypothetical protein N7462_005883 [Penicillium macrosclerotiorum]